MERHEADTLIRTKLHLPFTRPELVPRPRLQAQVLGGLHRPLTLITAPAGFGKTTLVASCIAGAGMPVAWLSLDRDDNEEERFLNYLVAALQKVDPTIGSEAAQLLSAARQAPSEAILTSLVNDLDARSGDIALVLDDYQLINGQAVHEQVAFLLDHCPNTFHLVIATRSDPPLPLTRMRARGQAVELRAADLRFTGPEAAQFLNDVMGLDLDAGLVHVLEERTEGWIAGLQMAALSMRDHRDLAGFIARFSGTNRYILDYLLEEVLAGQSPEVQRFLLFTSILERLSAPLCEAVIGPHDSSESENQGMGEAGTCADAQVLAFPLPDPAISTSKSILEYLERSNLFLVPLDDERIWYRYHHLFADLLRAQLYRSLGEQGVAPLHARAAEWHEQNGSILEAIHHASAASDDERVERLIEQSYMEIVKRGEQSLMRFWASRLSKELVYRRPWLCIYEAHSRAWFGELDEAEILLEKAQERIESEPSAPDLLAMQAHLAYVKSRVTAMRGDNRRAIEMCLAACAQVPADNVSLQFNTRVTLGYEYFLIGDYANAGQILHEAIESGIAASAVIYTVAAACFLARLYANQGRLHKAHDTYQMAAQLIAESREQHRDAMALVDVGLADLLCEWNDLDAALVHLQRSLTLLPLWGKADDLALACVTLARIRLAQAHTAEAIEAVDRATQAVQSNGVFGEARAAVEIAQAKLWLAQGDLPAAGRWAASAAERLGAPDDLRFEDELAQMTRARVLVSLKTPGEAVALLSRLKVAARSAGRMGRVIEILVLQALALHEMGDARGAMQALTQCLSLAMPEGYVRIFVDEGRPMRMLLARWQAQVSAGPARDYAIHLLCHFDGEPQVMSSALQQAAPTGDPSPGSGQALIEPLSPRELEVLHCIALGKTNREIAERLIIALGTVKAHTSSIYRKLDVANRTEAVARARQLGILP